MEHFYLKTENYQKDSCTIMALRKICTELSRKGTEAIRLGPEFLKRDSEEKGDYTGGNLP